jgi:hypothetical protein
VNNLSIPSTHLKEKLPFVLINNLLLHIPLLAHTDGQMERQTEKQIHSLRVGWRNFLPVVLLCQFFGFWREIGFGVTYLCISRVQYSCGIVLVFGSGGKWFLALHMYLVYNTLVWLCQFFGCGRK